ncbi:MAG TPA: hypothetical protein VJT49_16795 [Amycolatopsis sp.]|uniref:hypothetical protein n=1 Tax=Amycolatopsis sp. TaxID=37632 RepID=UPI002B47AF88|nr:hypothetical protein [Amycolatopsis sp.]HKS46733.1 hypothetical protein [Amycolatopsis sp.]
MDLTDTIAPTSDQLDAVDLLSGPRTFTIKAVSKGDAEQPVNIALVEFARPWRPGKSMRRVLVACWGADASTYAGRRVTLYCDPDVRFGGQAVGGTRISHLSHLDKPKQVPLLVSRGKSAVFIVRPLVETRETGAQAARPVPPPSEPEPDVEPGPTDAQMRKLHAMFNEAGIKDRDVRMRISSQLVKRPLTSSTDLTRQEMHGLIDALEDLAKQGPLGEMIDALLGDAADHANRENENGLLPTDPDLRAHERGDQ